MKKFSIQAELTVYETVAEMPLQAKGVMERAVEARNKSYSPYSRFQVGAALLLGNGQIITGSNQENASYPAGLCAERTAIFYAGAQYPDEQILMLCISARSMDYLVNRPTAPCGSCRQVLAEYQGKQDVPMEIYFMGEAGEVLKADSISDLLPLVFDKNYLKRL